MSDPLPFVHLHCHSHYSLLDGAARTEQLLERAKALRMNALAITDHGNLHGVVQFYREAKELGVKPILGFEAYVAPGSRFAKEAGHMKEASHHLTLLAKNITGFKNLLQLSSAAFLEGFYFKPRIDKELLETHREGLICLSGCVSSEISRVILAAGDAAIDKAVEIAQWYRDVFGDDYYLEIQNNGLDVQQIVLDGCVEVSERTGIPLVATSDVHYVHREDAEAQDVLLCINTGKFRTDSDRMRMEGDQFYLRSPEEMYAAFPGNEDAVKCSQEIANGVDIELELDSLHFPIFTPPEEKSPEAYLRELCLEGLKARYAGNANRMSQGELNEEVTARLDRELAVINKLGFPKYFLIVWDFVRFARSREIEVTARGSGVGSLVCYALHMSHVCPLEYDLLFERFLDESRREIPDIDIDFDKERRGEVMDYVKEKYNVENVAQIGTFNTLAARAAVRDTGRALGLSIPRVDAVVAMISEKPKTLIKDAIQKSDQLRRAHEGDAEVRELLELAMQVEGLARNVGTHACAVVIADRPLTEYVPLQHVGGKEEVVTQWSQGDVEAAGLLKMDFLGLRNLTILSKAVRLIEQTTGERIDPYKFPLEDKEAFALLCGGETKGVFQLESAGIRDLLQRMKPDNFLDVVATLALYRPGPLEGGMVDDYIEVKHGRQKAAYPHPVMREVLTETHGVMVYQEQVMRILNLLGNIPLANAYTCIKAISKKKLPMIARFREQFVEGAHQNGMSKKKGADMFGLIEKFAGYGFNKSHSTAYALIAYMTAYLKAHYPIEFMAALLSSDIAGRNLKRKDSLVEHLEDCQRMGIEVEPPDVNSSEREFTVDGRKIHFGLAAIKGCGDMAADAIAASRREKGRYRSLFEFCERIDPSVCNRSALETLIKAGAFDSLGTHRSQLSAAIDRAIQSGTAAAADRRSGQMGLFGPDDDEPEDAAANLPDLPEWEERDKLTKEKEVLGFYLSSHPLEEHQKTLDIYCTYTTAEAVELKHGTDVVLGGMLEAIKFSNTKNTKPGNSSRYATFLLEDSKGTMRCILWPEPFLEHGNLVTNGAIVIAQGTVDKRPGSDEANVIVKELISLQDVDARYTRGMLIRVVENTHGQKGLEQLYEILRGYPGKAELQLMICLADGSRVSCKCNKLRLDINPELRARVDDLLGPGNARLLIAPPNGNGRANGRSRR